MRASSGSQPPESLCEIVATCSVRVAIDAPRRPTDADAEALIAAMLRYGIEEHFGTARQLTVALRHEEDD